MNTYNLTMKAKVEGNGVMRFNHIKCKEEDLINKIYEWIYQVNRDFSFRDMEILSIEVNGEDYTEKLKKR